MKTVGIAEAKAKFAALVDEAASGEEIIITRKGVPLARLSTLTADVVAGSGLTVKEYGGQFHIESAREVGEAATNAAPRAWAEAPRFEPAPQDITRHGINTELFARTFDKPKQTAAQRPGLTLADMMKLTRGN